MLVGCWFLFNGSTFQDTNLVFGYGGLVVLLTMFFVLFSLARENAPGTELHWLVWLGRQLCG